MSANVKDPHEERISREEEHWNTPRLLRLGFVFLGVCLVIIYVIASV